MEWCRLIFFEMASMCLYFTPFLVDICPSNEEIWLHFPATAEVDRNPAEGVVGSAAKAMWPPKRPNDWSAVGWCCTRARHTTSEVRLWWYISSGPSSTASKPAIGGAGGQQWRSRVRSMRPVAWSWDCQRLKLICVKIRASTGDHCHSMRFIETVSEQSICLNTLFLYEHGIGIRDRR